MRYIVIETNIDRKVPPDDRPSNLPAMEQDHAEHVASALNSRLGWDATRWWVARPETAIAAPAPTDTRADFEAHFQLNSRQKWQHKDGRYMSPEIQAKWEGYLAGVAKAAPAVQEPIGKVCVFRGTSDGDVFDISTTGTQRDRIMQMDGMPIYAAPVAAAAPGAVPDERKPKAWLSDNGFLISAAQKAAAIEKGDTWHLGYHRPLYE